MKRQHTEWKKKIKNKNNKKKKKKKKKIIKHINIVKNKNSCYNKILKFKYYG